MYMRNKGKQWRSRTFKGTYYVKNKLIREDLVKDRWTVQQYFRMKIDSQYQSKNTNKLTLIQVCTYLFPWLIWKSCEDHLSSLNPRTFWTCPLALEKRHEFAYSIRLQRQEPCPRKRWCKESILSIWFLCSSLRSWSHTSGCWFASNQYISYRRPWQGKG